MSSFRSGSSSTSLVTGMRAAKALARPRRPKICQSHTFTIGTKILKSGTHARIQKVLSEAVLQLSQVFF